MQTHAAHEIQLDFAVKFTSLWRGRKRINHSQNGSLKSWPAPHPGGKVCVATGTRLILQESQTVIDIYVPHCFCLMHC